jgi:putative inorganic carbon (HCO3(-)) transporter
MARRRGTARSLQSGVAGTIMSAVDVTSATLRWQRWLLVGTVLVTPLLVNRRSNDNFSLPQATFVVLAAVALLWVAVVRVSWWRRLVVPRSPVVFAAAVFAAGIIVATLTSTSRLQSVVGQHGQYTGLAQYLACVVLLVAAARAFTAGTVVWLLRALAGAMLGVGGYAVVEKLGFDPFGIHGGSTQIVSTLGNSNFLAGWVGMAVGPCLVLACLRREHPAWRVVGAAGVVLGLVAAQASGSFQGPITAGASLLAAAAGVVAVRRPLQRWWTRRNVIVAVMVVVVVTAAGLAVGGSFVRRSIDNGLYDRKAFWRAAIGVVADHPLTGTGPDTFHNQFLTRRPSGSAGENAGAVHDVPLDLLANGGLVTGLPYLAFLGFTAMAIVRALRRSEGEHRLVVAGLAAAWTGYLVQSLVSIDKAPLAATHWVLAGAFVALTAGPPVTWTLPGALDGRRQAQRGGGWLVPVGLASVAALAALVPLTRPIRADAAVHAASRTTDAAVAIDRVERGIALAPWEADHTYFAARIYVQAERPSEALAVAEKGARLQPGDDTFAKFAAQVAGVVQNHGRAHIWWVEAIRRNPPYTASIQIEAAYAAGERKDRRDIAYWVGRIRTVSGPLAAFHVEARALAKLGDTDAARASYDQALELAEDPETIKLLRKERRDLDR